MRSFELTTANGNDAKQGAAMTYVQAVVTDLCDLGLTLGNHRLCRIITPHRRLITCIADECLCKQERLAPGIRDTPAMHQTVLEHPGSRRVALARIDVAHPHQRPGQSLVEIQGSRSLDALLAQLASEGWIEIGGQRGSTVERACIVNRRRAAFPAEGLGQPVLPANHLFPVHVFVPEPRQRAEQL